MPVEMTGCKEFLKHPGKQESKKVIEREGRRINGKLIHVGWFELSAESQVSPKAEFCRSTHRGC